MKGYIYFANNQVKIIFTEIIGIPHGIEEVEEAEAAEEALEAAEVSATKALEAAIVGVASGLVVIGRHPLAAR